VNPGRKKQGHGPIPTYETRTSIEKRDLDEFAWLTLPDPARVYDSSLSKPGRLCRHCRSFVAGGISRLVEKPVGGVGSSGDPDGKVREPGGRTIKRGSSRFEIAGRRRWWALGARPDLDFDLHAI
jgi:hypothetical protein